MPIRPFSTDVVIAKNVEFGRQTRAWSRWGSSAPNPAWNQWMCLPMALLTTKCIIIIVLFYTDAKFAIAEEIYITQDRVFESMANSSSLNSKLGTSRASSRPTVPDAASMPALPSSWDAFQANEAAKTASTAPVFLKRPPA
eukprot:scaffold10851_cov129-Cyclotella_meneghiniana.AAC.1